MQTRTARLTAVLCLAAAAGTACGSNSGSKAASTAAVSGKTTTSAATTPTGQPIRLMTMTSETGSASLEPQVIVGAKAAVAAVNKAGGVQGRPLTLDACDDQGNPNVAADCARQAVSNHDIAMVGTTTAQGDSYMPIIEAAGIPSIANLAATSKEITSPLSFPFSGGSVTAVYSTGALAGEVGCKKVKVIYVDFAAAKSLVNGFFAKGMAPFGLTLAGVVPIPPTAVDVSPYAAQAMSGGTDCVSGVVGGNLVPVLVKALADAGYQGQYLAQSGVISPQVISQLGPAANMISMAGTMRPTTQLGDAGIAAFNDEVDAIGDKTSSRDENMLNSWAGVHVVANLLQKVSTIDSASLVAAMKAAGPINFDPVAPFDWSNPSALLPAPLHAYGSQFLFSQVRDGKIQTLLDGKFIDLLNPR